MAFNTGISVSAQTKLSLKNNANCMVMGPKQYIHMAILKSKKSILKCSIRCFNHVGFFWKKLGTKWIDTVGHED